MQVVLTTIEPSKTRQDLSYDAYEYTVITFAKPAQPLVSLSMGSPGSGLQCTVFGQNDVLTCKLCNMQVHSHTYDSADIPSAKFTYDLSPIQILVSEKHRAW